MKNVLLILSAVLVFGLAASAQEVPKAEVFMGYEYIRFAPALSGNPNFNMHGGGGAVTYNFSKYFGLKAEFTGAGGGDLKQCASTGLNCVTRSANFFTYLFGPQAAIRSQSKLTPFAHLLFGGAYSNAYANLQQAGTVSTTPTVADFGKHAFAMAVGGGLDLKASKSIAIRLGQFDYFMTRFSGRALNTSGTGSVGSLGISNQSSFRYMGGVVFHIGRRNILPPSVTCSATKSSIIQGETTTIQAKASDPEGAGLTYSWSASGGKVTGSGENATFDSTGVAPGKYTTTASVFDGKYKADCSAEVTVLKRNRPPTATVEPSTFGITQGESANLRCNASDPDNDSLTYAWSVDGQRLAAAGPQITFGSEGRKPGNYTVTCSVSDAEASASGSAKGTIRERIIPNKPPTIECLTTTMDVASGSSIELRARASDSDGDKLAYNWSATGGTVSGTGEAATFNAAGVRAGSYTVTATVDDGRGGKASCSMMVNVSERLSVTKEKCGYFAPGKTRVDNCAKAILDDLAIRMKNDPKLRANIIGYTDGSSMEKSKKALGESRAKAVAAFLEQQGVEASRLTTTDGGANNPVGDNKKVAGQQLNRRVEIELSVR
jgi:outer membrane protein OmpA-like peptidoglycan-associated protein